VPQKHSDERGQNRDQEQLPDGLPVGKRESLCSKPEQLEVPAHDQGQHEGREETGQCGQADGQREVALHQVTEHVRGRPAGHQRDQEQARRRHHRERQHQHHRPGQKRQRQNLQTQADQHPAGMPPDADEVGDP
jgi:hypothetical protein